MPRHELEMSYRSTHNACRDVMPFLLQYDGDG